MHSLKWSKPGAIKRHRAHTGQIMRALLGFNRSDDRQGTWNRGINKRKRQDRAGLTGKAYRRVLKTLRRAALKEATQHG